MFFENNDYNKPTRDPRLYETILVNGAKWSGRSVELWVGGRENANSTSTETGQYATGFGLYKFYKEGKGRSKRSARLLRIISKKRTSYNPSSQARSRNISSIKAFESDSKFLS